MDDAIGGTKGVRATRVRQSKIRKEDGHAAVMSTHWLIILIRIQTK